MRVSGPVLDAADAIGLAIFYQRLLGWEITEREGPRPGHPPEDGWARITSPSGDTKIEFQWEQHYTPPVWPPVEGEQQMMIHLDIAVEDLDQGVAWAIESGATEAEHQPQEGVRVMLDPAGHPFCLFPGDV
jgi:hypothetical protein